MTFNLILTPLIIALGLELFGQSALADETPQTDFYPNKISIKLGIHNFFPDQAPHRGKKPDGDGVVTEEEWEYIFDEGYRIQDFDGATIELGYEYMFLKWLGLACDMGIYGNQKQYNFAVSGWDVKTRATISVFHFDITPRFHWQTKRTDLYGGLSLGYYSMNFKYYSEVKYGALYGELTDEERKGTLGVGLQIGFELKVSSHFGMAVEEKLISAVIPPDKSDAESKPTQIGGNIIAVLAKASF